MSSDSTIGMQQDNISTDMFVGRKTEQDLYAKLLSRNTPWVLMITGLGGIGKSTLLNTLYTNTPSEICIVTFDFADRSLRTDPSAFISRLATETYRRCNIEQNGETTINFQNYIQQLAILSTKPSLQISEGKSVTEEIGSIQNQLNELTSHEIYYQLQGLVTEAFYDQLDILPLKQLVFLLDTCELLAEPEGWEIGQWVMDELLPGLHTRLQQIDKKFSVVIASRVKLQLELIDKQDQQHIVLSMLEKGAVDQYLEHMGIRDQELHQRVYDITHGHALCVSIIGKLWQEQSLTLTDLPTPEKFSEIEKFSEYALMRFTNDRILVHLKSPYRELTRYGVILRSFNLPILKAIFPDLLPESEAFDLFDRLIRYPYIESMGNHFYAFHELRREALSEELQTKVEENEKWKYYHKRALYYFTEVLPDSPEIYFHAIACDEKLGMAEWQWKLHEIENVPIARGALLQVTYDKTLRLTQESQAVRNLEKGRFLSATAQWLDESGIKEQARAKQKEALETLSEAKLLFQNAGDNIGEAETQGTIIAIQQRTALPRITLKLYEQMSNPSNFFPEESNISQSTKEPQPEESGSVAHYLPMEELPLKPPPPQYAVQPPPPVQEGSERIENPITGREEALTIRFAIGKLIDYLFFLLLGLELIFLTRLLLKLIGANPNNFFAGFLYGLSGLLLFPFSGIAPSLIIPPLNQPLEISTLVGMFIYFLIFFMIARFLKILISGPESYKEELDPESHKAPNERAFASNLAIDTMEKTSLYRGVPNLQKLDLFTAAERARALGMRVVPVGEVSTYPNIAPGLIVSQNPMPGTLMSVTDSNEKLEIHVYLSMRP